MNGTAVRELLARATARKEVRPPDGKSNSRFERVEIDGQRYFLKRLSPATDAVSARSPAPYSGRMVEATFSDKLSKLRQRRSGPLILELDLTEGIGEEPPSDVVSAVLTMRRPRLADVLDGLRRARADDKVHALVVKIGGRRTGLARVQELHAAITEFRRSGKATVAWGRRSGSSLPATPRTTSPPRSTASGSSRPVTWA
jgi:hypothetical protein